MIKKISHSKARSRKAMLRGFLRWFLYSAVLLLFYIWETNPMIRAGMSFCPLLIIPLATAVAMNESDFSSAVFGVFCGFMLDMASGTILGFTSLWLLVLCPMISLAAQFWIKGNFFSHFILTLAACVILGFLDYLFLHWVWEGSQSSISFFRSILPAYGSAALLSVPVYFAVRSISRRLRPKEERKLQESAQSAEETEKKENGT